MSNTSSNGCMGCAGIILLIFIGGPMLIEIFNPILTDMFNLGRKCILDRQDRHERRIAEEKEKEILQKQADEDVAALKRAELEEQKRKEHEKQKLAEREERLKSFILHDAPSMMLAYRNLEAEIRVQNKRIDELSRTLRTFGRNPESDPDYIRIVTMRQELDGMLKSIRRKMEDVYLAAKKFEATPGASNSAELKQHALDDGIREADAIVQKFEEMKKLK